ncbi:unnamed protein product [Blepharisma stoltei]|uniref:Uncharacterized protein n=1 Tax=Blepharisma stoltei TaxID=1481888 RepID=A0AAU9IG37_9CILI|nr:unnamed protein product [Blepharisma stoltei]
MADIQIFQEKIASLQRENDDLHDLNNRLNQELRRYQINQSQELPAQSDLLVDPSIPPWAANTVFLSPLLLAYDNRIHELESALERAKLNLIDIGEHTKRLTAENSSLREEMDRRWHEMLERERKELESSGIGAAFYLEEKNEMQERLDLLSTENNLLLEQLEALKTRNELLERVAKDRDEAAEKYGSQLKQLISDHRNLQMNEEEIRGYKEIAEEKLKKAQERLGNLEREREEQNTLINRIQNELRLAKQNGEYYRKAYEEIDAKKSEEIEMLIQEAHNNSIRDRDLTNKSIMQERDLEEAKDQANYYKRECDSIKNECENMLKIMNSYEEKLAKYQQKEEALDQRERDAKQRVEDAFLERDRMAMKDQQYQRQIERLNEQLRTELGEQKAKFDIMMDSMRNKHKNLLATRDDELKSIQERNNELQLQAERLARDNSSLAKDVQRAENVLQEEQKRINVRLDEYERRMRETEEVRLTEKRLLETQNEQYGYERQEWDRLKKNYENLIHSSNREIESIKASLKRSKEESRRHKGQFEEVSKERDNLVEELNKLRDDFYIKTQELGASYNAKLVDVERNIAEARERQRLAEEKYNEFVASQAKLGEKWRDEHKAISAYYTKLLNQMTLEKNKLIKRNRELEGRGDIFAVQE